MTSTSTGPEPAEAALAELLDLDAEVLHAYLTDVIGWVGELAGGPPRRILNLGTGTGTGASPWPGASRGRR